jgi:hypothetical protein
MGGDREGKEGGKRKLVMLSKEGVKWRGEDREEWKKEIEWGKGKYKEWYWRNNK